MRNLYVYLILAGQKAATQPESPAHVVEVPFPDSGRRPVNVETVNGMDGIEAMGGDEFEE